MSYHIKEMKTKKHFCLEETKITALRLFASANQSNFRGIISTYFFARFI